MQTTRGTSLNRRGRVVFPLVAGVIIAIDQLTKVFAVARLEGGKPIVVIDGWLSLTFVRNPGAAFSFAENFTIVFAILACGVSAYIWWLSRRVTNRMWALALGLLFAGAMGNLLDRIFREPGFLRGHVVDFIQFTFINFPVFNVADIALTIGAFVVVIQSWRGIELNGKPHG